MTKRVMRSHLRRPRVWCVRSGDWCRFVSICGLRKRAGSLSCVSITCGVCQKKPASGDSASCVARNTQTTQRSHTHAAHGDTHTHTRARQEKHTGWVVGALQMKLCSGPAAAYSSAGGSSGAFFVGFAGGLERVGLG